MSSLQRLLDKRVLFFGGKGGVGKTTISRRAADHWAKTREVVSLSVESLDANALYSAAMAALLSACPQSDVTPAPEAAIVQPAGEADAATADMPTVVITASRERPKAIG